MTKPARRNPVIYIRHESGANHQYSGRRAAKLVRELEAGRGGPECFALEMAGYEGFVGARNGTVDVFDFCELTAADFYG